MPYHDDEQHERAEEYTSRFKIPKHYPHRAGKTGHCLDRFPSQDYVDSKALSLCGVENPEVNGFYGFNHVRCPWASRTPCLICGRHSLHIDSLIVAIDGACPGNGTHNATKSACGVFFGPDRPENLAFRVPDTPGYSHTNQRAELSAAIAAVTASVKFIYNGGQWDCKDCPTPCPVVHLVIKSDSAYLVNGMTAHMEKWQKNGWRTAKGPEVKNKDLWTELEGLIRLLHNDKGVVVDFWHVLRDQNTDADYLANQGLDEPAPRY
ncbi:ribonuclease H-like protein [Xylaria sp. FL1042]|nr:ribonuclease H-like protein [Xylaria sp. FL1042]